VDSFFDQVMVMAEEMSVRNNRLALLRSLGELMNGVADISKLAG
jgi:glycyl-tRNA synthetase beta chain